MNDRPITVAADEGTTMLRQRRSFPSPNGLPATLRERGLCLYIPLAERLIRNRSPAG